MQSFDNMSIDVCGKERESGQKACGWMVSLSDNRGPINSREILMFVCKYIERPIDR